MKDKKKIHPKQKRGLHPRNQHSGRYDFKTLVGNCPELEPFVRLNDHQDESIDFFNPEAVKMLNKALLRHFYHIDSWDIPTGYLCPPIPGRADYIHHIADLLASCNNQHIPTGDKIKGLDIGVGANCIYPLLGTTTYGWSFIGADIDPVAVTSAKAIIEANTALTGKIDLRLQANPKEIFQGMIQKGEYIDFSICNPPFHASAKEALSATTRKLKNLNAPKTVRPLRNFSGTQNELWCEGGEKKFVEDMIRQSKTFASSCFWFSSLISKETNLKSAYESLKIVKAAEVKTIPMVHGNKKNRILAWTFLSPEQQKTWMDFRWR